MSSISNVYHDYSSFLNATTFSQVYQNFNQLDNLNVFEKLWGSYYYYMANDLFATGLLFFLTHEIFYFRKWKIQDEKIPSDKEQWECLKSVLTSHFLVEAFPIWFFHPLCQKIGISYQVSEVR